MVFSRFWNCTRVPNRPWHLTCLIRCMVRIILIENPWTQYLIAYAWTAKLNQDFKAKLHHHLSFTKSSKLKYIYIYISYIYIYLIYIYIYLIYITHIYIYIYMYIYILTNSRYNNFSITTLDLANGNTSWKTQKNLFRA